VNLSSNPLLIVNVVEIAGWFSYEIWIPSKNKTQRQRASGSRVVAILEKRSNSLVNPIAGDPLRLEPK